MRALKLTAADGPSSATLAQIEQPSPQPGQVRVALGAAALNHRELWITRGQYPGMQLPCTMGCDGAGAIEAVGAGVERSSVGREVVLYPGLNWGPDPRFPAADFALLGMPGPGTIAEYICVPAQNAVARPAFLSLEEAAALPLAALTAWRGLTTKAALASGEKVLVTGVGGGVAMFALKFAVALGANVFVTSGCAETLARAKQLGAQGGFNYKDPDWRRAVPKATGGLDVVFDGSPAASYPNYARALNMGARVVVYGSTGGMQFPVGAPELFLKNLTLIGTNVGSLQEFHAMLAFVERHRIKPEIDRTFGLDAASDALAYLETAHQFGKIVITI